MQQHGSKYFAHRHTLDPRGWGKKAKPFFFSTPEMGSKCQFFFSESGIVAYQVKVKK